MINELRIKCPHCNSILIIDRATEKVIEVRVPLVENSSGDRLEDAFKKYEKEKKEAEAKLKESLDYEKQKKEKIEELFEKKLKEIKE